jgi:hypothetical protein
MLWRDAEKQFLKFSKPVEQGTLQTSGLSVRAIAAKLECGEMLLWSVLEYCSLKVSVVHNRRGKTPCHTAFRPIEDATQIISIPFEQSASVPSLTRQ